MDTNVRSLGFSLVELLVVVTLIATLILIALPSLQAAMVRARVARAESDLRTLFIAIEAYRVTTGQIPYDGEPFSYDVGWAASLAAVTTPVAYISAIPADVFQDPIVQTYPFAASHMIDPAPSTVHSYQYDSRRFVGGESNPATGAAWDQVFAGKLYLLRSRGPGRVDVSFQQPDWGYHSRYDPTNGTVCSGNIFR